MTATAELSDFTVLLSDIDANNERVVVVQASSKVDAEEQAIPLYQAELEAGWDADGDPFEIPREDVVVIATVAGNVPYERDIKLKQPETWTVFGFDPQGKRTTACFSGSDYLEPLYAAMGSDPAQKYDWAMCLRGEHVGL